MWHQKGKAIELNGNNIDTKNEKHDQEDQWILAGHIGRMNEW